MGLSRRAPLLASALLLVLFCADTYATREVPASLQRSLSRNIGSASNLKALEVSGVETAKSKTCRLNTYETYLGQAIYAYEVRALRPCVTCGMPPCPPASTPHFLQCIEMAVKQREYALTHIRCMLDITELRRQAGVTTCPNFSCSSS